MKLGGLVAFPTETVYGLGASIFNISAIANIFEVKGRPADNPLIAHVSQAQDWVKLADNVPSDFHRLTKAFFPGPLTLIVRKKEKIPLIATGGLDTIAIRCPDKIIARQLIFAVNEPIEIELKRMNNQRKYSLFTVVERLESCVLLLMR